MKRPAAPAWKTRILCNIALLLASSAAHGDLWAVGWGGTVIHSSDHVSWERQGMPGLEGVFFLDASNGWAVGEGGAIAHTSDGGSTWTFQTSGTTKDLHAVYFVDASTGWAVGGTTVSGASGVILHTSDGGTTWTTQTSGNVPYYDVAFLDANTGLAVGGFGETASTSDGGSTWTATVPITDLYETYLGLASIDGTSGWVVGTNGTIVRWTDGGLTTFTQASGTSQDLHAIAAAGADLAWAVGNYGTILVTPDGGANWYPQSSGTTADLRDVHFADGYTGWVVGEDGVVLRTSDSGNTWTQQPAGLGFMLTGLAFAGASEGWAVGPDGEILHTTDGGATWVAQTSATGGTLLGVSFPDPSHGWIVGTSPSDGWIAGRSTTRTHIRILATSDGGTTWTEQCCPWRHSDSYLYDVDFVDASTGWAVGGFNPGHGGEDDNILKTTDGGATWVGQSVAMGGGAFDPHLEWFAYAVVDFVDASHGGAIGWGAEPDTGGGTTVIRTDDGGASPWVADCCLVPMSTFLLDMDFVDTVHGWAVGRDGAILRREEDGLWHSQSSGTTETLAGVDFADATTGWAVGNYGTILHTSDGGATWTPQTSGTTEHIHGVLAESATEAWAVGDGGTVLHTSDGGATWSALDSGIDASLYRIALAGSPAPVDLSISMSDASDPITVGNVLSYTITVENLDPSASAGDVVVEDSLPAGVAFVSSAQCVDGTPVVCELGSLGPGQSVGAVITVDTLSPGLWSNTATVSSANADPEPSNDTAVETTQLSACDPLDCDDVDDCTADSCDDALGCAHVPVPACTVPVAAPAPGDALVVDASRQALMRVDAASGDRTIVSAASTGAGPAFGAPDAVVMDANGTALWVADESTGDLLEVDPATGDRTVIASGLPIRDLAVDGSTLLAARWYPAELWRIDPATGSMSLLSNTPDLDVLLYAVALDPAGGILVGSAGYLYGNAIVSVDPVTGAATVVSSAEVGVGGGPSLGDLPLDLLVEADGTIVVVTVDALFRVNPASGDRTLVSGRGTGSGPDFQWASGLARRNDGTFLVSDRDAQAVLSVDPATGARAIVSGAGTGSGTTWATPQKIVLVPLDDDGDGVANQVEEAGPNGGDANGDGTPDSLQSDVAARPDATGSSYVAVEVAGGCNDLYDVHVMSEAETGRADLLFDYPLGLVSFRAPCSAATVTLYFHGSTALSAPYRKYGPTTPGDPATTDWYSLPGVVFGTATVGAATVATATLQLVDGALGDDTGVDLEIVDAGGPAALVPPGAWKEVTFSFETTPLDPRLSPIAGTGTGVAVVNGGSGGGALESLSLPAGLIAATAEPLTSSLGTAAYVTFSNATGAFSATSPAGPFGGVMPIPGQLRLCLVAGCGATLPVPLTASGTRGVGIGSAPITTATPGSGFVVTLHGAPWTTATVSMPTLNGTAVRMGFVHGPASGTDRASAATTSAVVQLVTPIRVEPSDGPPVLAFSTLTLHFVPEPWWAAQLGAGAALLLALGWRRRRSR